MKSYIKDVWLGDWIGLAASLLIVIAFVFVAVGGVWLWSVQPSEVRCTSELTDGAITTCMGREERDCKHVGAMFEDAWECTEWGAR